MATSSEPSFKKLPMADSFAIHHWLTANWSKIVAEKPTYDQAGEMIKAELNISVPKGSLAKVVLASGLTWPNTKKGVGRPGANKTNASRRLAGYIAILFDKLGEPRPAGLTDMIGGKRHDGEAVPLFNEPKHP